MSIVPVIKFSRLCQVYLHNPSSARHNQSVLKTLFEYPRKQLYIDNVLSSSITFKHLNSVFLQI